MELLRWQWSKYADTHTDGRNLVIHLVTTPFFIAGLVLLPLAVSRGAWIVAGLAIALLPLALGLQGYGHSREARSPSPFRGPFDAMTRILAEQLITFPRFVLSGCCGRAWHAQGRSAEHCRAKAPKASVLATACELPASTISSHDLPMSSPPQAKPRLATPQATSRALAFTGVAPFADEIVTLQRD